MMKREVKTKRHSFAHIYLLKIDPFSGIIVFP